MRTLNTEKELEQFNLYSDRITKLEEKIKTLTEEKEDIQVERWIFMHGIWETSPFWFTARQINILHKMRLEEANKTPEIKEL